MFTLRPRVLAFVVAGLGAASYAPAAASVPPILDRELFLGDPAISQGALSPDGTFVAFMKPYKETRNIWVKRTDEPFEKARPLTAETKRPIPAFAWSRDGKLVLYVKDEGGDENFNVYAIDPAAAPAKDSDVPASRNLTNVKGVHTQTVEFPKSDPDVMYVGLTDRDPSWHDLYKVKISTGERTLVYKNTERVVGWVFDQQGRLRLAMRALESGDTEILRMDGDKLTKIYGCGVLESCGPVRFHKDGKRVYLTSNHGDGVDLTRLVLLDVDTLKEELVESDPDRRVDFGSALFSEKTDELVGTSYMEDGVRYYWRDKSFADDYALVAQKLPGRQIAASSSTDDERLWLLSATSDTEPGERYLFDRGTKKLTLQYRLWEKLPREALATMKPIRYPSVDGLEIPAYLTLPKGVAAKNLPLLVMPHGGPWARDTWGYNRYAQYFANRGYAVLQPNFRGSEGFGKKFIDAGNLEWGDKMQDDLTAGVKKLVADGIADPKRVGIMGGSYGGYATLAGLAFTPDLYGAGVAIVGPSSLLTLLDTIPPYWEAGRKMFHMRMGNPTTPEGKARLERQSPLYSSAKMKAPLMVIQGANDPRVKKAESDQIVIALRDRGFPVEYIVADDEGHGFARPVNNMAAYASAEKFLAKHLGGRYQEGAPPNVAQRLAEITVDPKTVTVARRVDAASVGVPKSVASLKPGVLNYKAKIEMAGNTMDMSVSSEIKADGDSFVLTDSAQTPMGPVTDRTVVAKDTLVVRSRSVAQGPMTIDVSFADGHAQGEMKMGGPAKALTAEVGGEIFADGACASQVMATLPLAEGYETAYRNFDLQTQKTKTMALKVAAVERVTVPAGTFDAYRVEVSSADDGSKATVWVAKDARTVVKTVAVEPSMGGATITSELVN